MARPIGEHYEGDVRVSWHFDPAEQRIAVKREQDVESVLDAVAQVNANGVQTIDGVGRPVIEMPLVLAMDWCAQRGIPWEKFLYSNDYDAEWKRFAAEHSKLAYQAKPRHIAL